MNGRLQRRLGICVAQGSQIFGEIFLAYQGDGVVVAQHTALAVERILVQVAQPVAGKRRRIRRSVCSIPDVRNDCPVRKIGDLA